MKYKRKKLEDDKVIIKNQYGGVVDNKFQLMDIISPNKVDTTGFQNKAIELNKKYANLNWIKRQNTPNKNELRYIFKPEDHQEGDYGTMLTSYSTNKEGNQIAFPQIQQLPGQNKLTYFPN